MALRTSRNLSRPRGPLCRVLAPKRCEDDGELERRNTCFVLDLFYLSTRARAHRKCLTKEYYGWKKVTLQEKGKHVFTVKATDIVHGDAPRTAGRFLPPGTYLQHMFPISQDALCVPGKKVRGKMVIQPGRKRQVVPGVIPDASARFLHGARWLT